MNVSAKIILGDPAGDGGAKESRKGQKKKLGGGGNKRQACVFFFPFRLSLAPLVSAHGSPRTCKNDPLFSVFRHFSAGRI